MTQKTTQKPTTIKELATEYAMQFLGECTERTNTLMLAKDMYPAFQIWYAKQDLPPISIRRGLGRAMQQSGICTGFVRLDNKTTRVIVGIRLKPHIEVETSIGEKK